MKRNRHTLRALTLIRATRGDGSPYTKPSLALRKARRRNNLRSRSRTGGRGR